MNYYYFMMSSKPRTGQSIITSVHFITNNPGTKKETCEPCMVSLINYCHVANLWRYLNVSIESSDLILKKARQL